MSAIPTTSGEMFLAGWRETHNGGFVASFLVDADIEARIRRGTVGKGKVAGQRYAVVLVELGPDEKPVPDTPKAKATVLVPPKVEPTFPSPADVVDKATAAIDAQMNRAPAEEKRKGSHFPDGLTGLAVRWCADEHFQAWVSNRFAKEWLEVATGENDEDAAKHVVITRCQCQSRKSLNTDEFAAEIFKRDFLAPYHEVRKEDGVDDGNPF
jgi:hypothetical protein